LADDTTNKERGIAAKKVSAQQDAAMYQGQKRALKEEIASLQNKLDSARHDVDRAQGEVDWLRDQPLVSEPSSLEELVQVQRILPNKSLPTKGQFQSFAGNWKMLIEWFIERGAMVGLKDLIFGKSDEHIKEDAKAQEAHSTSVQKLQNEALARAREQRDHQRRLAADRLKEAREIEGKTKSALDAVHQELTASNYQLAQAKSNLDKTKSDLILLGNKAIELVSWIRQLFCFCY
jgi:hypothetical protein